MNRIIKPWEGEPGIVCLPRAINLILHNVEEMHTNWKLVECFCCGAECYLSPEAETFIKEQAGRVVGACTDCALRMGGAIKGGIN